MQSRRSLAGDTSAALAQTNLSTPSVANG